MVVLDDETGEEGARVAVALFERLERLGVYEREARPWLPHVTVLRFRSRPRLDPPVPDLGAVSTVRRCCLHVIPAADRGAVQSLGIGTARRLIG